MVFGAVCAIYSMAVLVVRLHVDIVDCAVADVLDRVVDN